MTYLGQIIQLQLNTNEDPSSAVANVNAGLPGWGLISATAVNYVKNGFLFIWKLPAI